MEIGNRNVIGYVRTAVADPTGKILNTQMKEIRQHCDENELNLLRIFMDNGASGLNLNRDGWNELKEYMHHNKGNVQSLVVTNYDRISRDVDQLIKETKKLEEDFGIKVSPAGVPAHLENMIKKIQGMLTQKHKTRKRLKR